MRILYFEPSMGAAGDMICACLYELLDEERKNRYMQKMNSLMEGVDVEARESVKRGIRGTRMEVKIGSAGHGVRLADIDEKLAVMDLKENIKRDVREIYGMIARAEGKAHGMEADQIHFHETGDKDALADISGAAVLMDMIKPEKVVCGTVTTGFGTVECAHGVLPVPAPATAAILEGIPVRAGDVEGELCTPTGAAILKYYSGSFSAMPAMRVTAIGHGMGKKDFERANMIRAYLGETCDPESMVIELVCNIDDMTGEEIGYACEKILEGKALDVYTQPIGMKKGRPGIRLSALCREEDRLSVAGDIFRHTRTIGLREYMCRRYELERDTVMRDGVRIKKASGFGTEKEKAEFDDRVKKAEEAGVSVLTE